MDVNDIMCHPILVLPLLQDFDVFNARVGAVRTPLKSEVIYHVNDLDAAPPERRGGDVRKLTKTSTVTDGSITTESLSDLDRSLRTNSWARQTSSERRTNASNSARTRRRCSECLGVSRINHLLRVHGHTILQEQRAAEIYDEIGQRSLERLFPSLTEDSMTQAALGVGQSGIGVKRPRDIAAPAHLGALIATKPRIRATIREQILEARFSEVIETVTSTYLSALDEDEQATAKLYVQKAAQAADEAWQQTVGGLQGPGVANPTIASLEHPRLRLPR